MKGDMIMERTYKPWQDWGYKSKQTEYTEKTPLFDDNGKLLAAGWAKHNVFEYDRNKVKPKMHRKEWDFYQISNGKYMVQLNFANITLGGYINAVLVDVTGGGEICNVMAPFVGQTNKYLLPLKGDEPSRLSYTIGKATFDFVTKENERTLYFKMDDTEAEFTMDMLPGHENITTVLPFDGYPDRYFMTTKLNCMPTSGFFKCGGKTYEFSKDDTFTVLDWGRVCTPYKMVWYWGNGSTYLEDAQGVKHTFGFEITWGIGNESNATETCIFYDGKAHKFGAIDVETFPKPDKYMEPWKFVSEDGRFNMTMTPVFDNHLDLDVKVMRMHSHQVHGKWNGTATLDDGTVLEIKDMYAFCEYVENRW